MRGNVHLQPDEHPLLKVHRHWIMLLRDISGILIIGIIPFILFPFIFTQVGNGSMSTSFIIFSSSFWLLIIWMMLFTIWTDYYLDVWIITDRRIIDIDQISLFNRKVSTLRIERVQDATVRVPNFMATLFGYGNVLIHTASGAKNISHMEGIPNPSEVQKIILERVDLMSDRYLPEDDGVDEDEQSYNERK